MVRFPLQVQAIINGGVEGEMSTRVLARTALLAAAYAAITVVLAPISYGPVQVRVSEALTLLPYFWGPWAAVGLWLGCIIANSWGGFGLLDVVLGCGLTLAAGLLTARMPSLGWAAVPPILLNALGVPIILVLMLDVPYWVTVLYVGFGQVLAVGVLGVPLAAALARRGLLTRDGQGWGRSGHP